MSTSSDLDVRDEDRLPWLETVDEEYEPGSPALRIILLVVLALAIVAAAIFGYSLYQKSKGADGNGALIAAQEGDYKVKPDDPGGLKVEGEGDSAIATSEGAGSGNASIDLKALPEAPVDGTRAAPGTPVTGGSSTTVATIPTSGGKLKAAAGAGTIAHAPAGSSASSLVQLGSFPDEATASSAWAKASKRFTYLAPLGKSVQKAEVNGVSVYRLRVNAGSSGQASELCGKLKVAGEDCFVPRN
jgi:hypothetical protein